MANSKDGQNHKDNNFDISKKILSQKMTICNMEALIFILAVNTYVIYFKLVKCQMSRSKGHVPIERSYIYHKEYSCEISKLNI